MSNTKPFIAQDAYVQLKNVERRLKALEVGQRTGYTNIDAASVPDLDSVGFTTYGDPAHVGPTVTVNSWGAGGQLFIILSADLAPGVGSVACMSYEIRDSTGAVVRAPSDAQGVRDDLAGNTDHFVRVFLVRGLEPGIYTVTMKFRVDGSVCGVSNRDLVVFPF